MAVVNSLVQNIDFNSATKSDVTFSNNVLSLSSIGTNFFKSYGYFETVTYDLSRYILNLKSIISTMSVPSETSVKFYTSTSEDNISFSPYEEINSEEGSILSPKGQFIRLKGELESPLLHTQETVYSFASTDSSKFNTNRFVVFNNLLSPNTSYSDLVISSEALGSGMLYTAPISKTDFKTIQSITSSYTATITQTFNYTGAVQSFVVPEGVTAVTASAYGASGGGRSAAGGKGGYSRGTIAVTPGETLYIYVGQAGGTSNATTFNGGGNGSVVSGASGRGGQGGGATDLRQGGTAAANRVIVAGGGGGGSYSYAGGAGGGYSNAGSRGSGSYGGYGGSSGSGGAGSGSGSTGTATNGGTGANGGGGGGGGYGGGGGGGDSSSSGSSGCGGGGGGGYVIATATNRTGSNGSRSGNGYLTITYNSPMYYLLQDKGELKRYANDVWEVVGSSPATEETIITNGMSSISEINSYAFDTLSDDTPTLLAYIGTTASIGLSLTLSAIPYGQTVTAIANVPLSGELTQIIPSETIMGGGIIRYAVSRDNGESWQARRSGVWIDLNIGDPTEYSLNGMKSEELISLSYDDWNSYVPTYNLRISFYLEINSLSDQATINNLTVATQYSSGSPTISYLGVSYEAVDPSYSGLLFSDSEDNYFSTSLGEVLKYLDFGTLIAGQTSIEVKVKLTNTYPFNVKDIVLMTEELNSEVSIQLSKTNAPFVGSNQITFNETLGFDESLEFYVRVSTTESANAGGNFDVKVEAALV